MIQDQLLHLFHFGKGGRTLEITEKTIFDSILVYLVGPCAAQLIEIVHAKIKSLQSARNLDKRNEGCQGIP